MTIETKKEEDKWDRLLEDKWDRLLEDKWDRLLEDKWDRLLEDKWAQDSKEEKDDQGKPKEFKGAQGVTLTEDKEAGKKGGFRETKKNNRDKSKQLDKGKQKGQE